MLGEFLCAGATRRYWTLSVMLALLFFGAMHVSLAIAPHVTALVLRVPGVLLPLLPLGGLVYLEYRRIRATDELRQRMELEACMLTLAAGVPLLLSFGLLAKASLIHVDPLLATPLLAATYVLAQLRAYWRYR